MLFTFASQPALKKKRAKHEEKLFSSLCCPTDLYRAVSAAASKLYRCSAQSWPHEFTVLSLFFFCVCVCVNFSFTFCATQRARVLSSHRCVKLHFTNESTVLYFGPFFVIVYFT